MGTLIAVKYPTKLFLKLADHTYVMCSTGAVRWSCWGGDQGGTSFKSGSASTVRADQIAGPDSKAGIACYLINGVCHQAANRILMPAEVTVQGARGYWVSSSLFGVYGRPFGPLHSCASPFNQHDGVTGDLPACVVGGSPVAPPPRLPDDDDPRHREFLAEMRRHYASAVERVTHLGDVREFQMSVFKPLVRYRLGDEFTQTREYSNLLALRQLVEEARVPLDMAVGKGRLSPAAFTVGINHLAIGFQVNTLDVIGAENYRRLFDLEPGDTVEIGDPEIAQAAYGQGRNDGEAQY